VKDRRSAGMGVPDEMVFELLDSAVAFKTLSSAFRKEVGQLTSRLRTTT